jgi:DinB family protein
MITMDQVKQNFLQNDFIPLLQKIELTTNPLWGKMNAQQMIEHVSGFFKLSTDKLRIPLVTAPEHLPKFKAFLLSEKEFRENTKAPVLPEDPLPVRTKDIIEARKELAQEVNDFFDFFRDNPDKTTLHPVFGDLNFSEWVLLHFKHVKHHLKQFGINVEC